MITRIIKRNFYEGDQYEIEEYETDVMCPECNSIDVDFADEEQPCDGTDLYDGLTYSVICNSCKHLFYEYEYLDTHLIGV